MMQRPLDPYEELGVARDASAADVRGAFRKRAKTAHPDAGGSAEEFDRLRRAMTILIDPAKRERFNSTGNTDDGPDNTRSNALQVIEKIMGDLVNGYLNQGRDPRQMDVVVHMKQTINSEVKQHKEAIKKGEQVIAFLRDMGKRMTTNTKDDPLGLSMAAHVQNAERQKRALEDGIAARKLAIKIISHYSFRWDQPTEEQMAQQAGGLSFVVRIG
jgi:curved DNA-binding protein CbpA